MTSTFIYALFFDISFHFTVSLVYNYSLQMRRLGCKDQRGHFNHEASDSEGKLWEEGEGKVGRAGWEAVSNQSVSNIEQERSTLVLR